MRHFADLIEQVWNKKATVDTKLDKARPETTLAIRIAVRGCRATCKVFLALEKYYQSRLDIKM